MGHAFRDEAGGFVTSAPVTGAIVAYSEVIVPNLKLYRVKAGAKGEVFKICVAMALTPV